MNKREYNSKFVKLDTFVDITYCTNTHIHTQGCIAAFEFSNNPLPDQQTIMIIHQITVKR